MKANAVLVQIASDCQWRNRLITAGHAHRSNVLLIQPLGCRYRNLFGSRTSLADCTAQLILAWTTYRWELTVYSRSIGRDLVQSK